MQVYAVLILKSKLRILYVIVLCDTGKGIDQSLHLSPKYQIKVNIYEG